MKGRELCSEILGEVYRIGLPLLERAMVSARRLHEGQLRKGTPIPYISHLMAVAALVQEAGADEEVTAAALLHDAVEDQDCSFEDLETYFGSRVAEIVRGCTDTDEPRASNGRTKEDSWARKLEYLQHLRTEDRPDALRVSLADKLHNARAVMLDYQRMGEALWERFNVGRHAQLEFYSLLADTFAEKLPDDHQALELSTTVARLRELIAESSD